jgi:hypothetical protein
MRCINPIALSFKLPLPIKIAKSSALERLDAHNRHNFSLGRSDSSQSLIVNFSGIVVMGHGYNQQFKK